MSRDILGHLLLPLSQDNGTRKKFCPGTTGCPVPVCPRTSRGTSCPLETLAQSITNLKCLIETEADYFSFECVNDEKNQSVYFFGISTKTLPKCWWNSLTNNFYSYFRKKTLKRIMFWIFRYKLYHRKYRNFHYEIRPGNNNQF